LKKPFEKPYNTKLYKTPLGKNVFANKWKILHLWGWKVEWDKILLKPRNPSHLLVINILSEYLDMDVLLEYFVGTLNHRNRK